MILHEIGVIKTSFKESNNTPIQSVYSEDNFGTIEIFPQYINGLQDLEGFERIWLLYWLHKSCQPEKSLKVIPFVDNQEHGIFATRSPCRPNPIGLSSVSLLKIDNNILHISGHY